jgi:putative ABC transport system permease protein
MTLLLIARRARRDLAVLLVWTALVAFAVALAVAQPRLLRETVDAGARQAVAAAGSEADVVASADVGTSDRSQRSPVSPKLVLAFAAALPHHLPDALRTVAAEPRLTVLGPITGLETIDGIAPAASHPIAVEVGMLTPQNTAALRIVSGSLPSIASGATIDVVLSQASARASGLAVGSVARVSTIPVSSAISGRAHVTMRVVGIVRESAASTASPWSDTPNLWSPTVPKGQDAPVGITVLASPAGVAAVSGHYANPFQLTLRISLVASRFTAAREARVGAEIIALAGHSNGLAGASGADVAVASGFGTALGGFSGEEQATVAQVSIVAAGAIGVAATVLLLVSRMLVLRREAELVLERARGASLWSMTARVFLETVLAGAIGAGLGLLLVQLLAPGRFFEPVLLGFVVAVTVLAIPLQTVLLVRGTGAGRKVPANRADRIDIVRRVRTRRIAVELTVLAVAVAAFISLSGRGLLETQTDGVDLLLSSSPLLLAASITIVILRVYRWPLQLAISAGRRSTGPLGLLAAARAGRAFAVLPLLALTLSVALAVGGGLLASTVGDGQAAASWQRVGADVRADTAVTDAQAAAIAAKPGVTAATAFSERPGVQLRLTGGTNFATLVAIDSRFPRFVSELPAGGASAPSTAALGALFTAGGSSASLPVVVDRDIDSQVNSTNIGMYVGVKFIPLRVVGVTDESLSGYLGAPFIYVDRAALSAQLGHSLPANILLVNGPGARAAVATLHAPKQAIHTRSGWLSARRRLALVSGVDQAIALATAATALAAVLALITIALSGARERGRSLALARTLGLPARQGWWLALAELAPVVVAALVGGIVAGVGIVLLLAPAMGLRELAGGLSDPPPTISPGFIAGLATAAVVLLFVAVLIEIAVRRRDRLSEVLRVGESI